MSELPAPTAQRLRKPSWRDSRLIIGVLMILASTAIGAFVISRADTRVPMYAAKDGLKVGAVLSENDVIRKDVQLGDGAEDYLSADDSLPPRTVINGVGAGELIPKSALGPSGEVKDQRVTLQVDATSAESLGVGSVVEVYVNESAGAVGEGNKFLPAKRAVDAAKVVAVAAEDDVIGGAGDTRAMQVLVPKDSVKGLVDDVANGAKITLVPIAGGNTKKAS